jgi:hypothetical protein
MGLDDPRHDGAKAHRIAVHDALHSRQAAQAEQAPDRVQIDAAPAQSYQTCAELRSLNRFRLPPDDANDGRWQSGSHMNS